MQPIFNLWSTFPTKNEQIALSLLLLLCSQYYIIGLLINKTDSFDKQFFTCCIRTRRLSWPSKPWNCQSPFIVYENMNQTFTSRSLDAWNNSPASDWAKVSLSLSFLSSFPPCCGISDVDHSDWSSLEKWTPCCAWGQECSLQLALQLCSTHSPESCSHIQPVPCSPLSPSHRWGWSEVNLYPSGPAAHAE